MKKENLFKCLYRLSRTVWACEPAGAFTPSLRFVHEKCLVAVFQKAVASIMLVPTRGTWWATSPRGGEAAVHALVYQSSFKEAGSKSTGTERVSEL